MQTVDPEPIQHQPGWLANNLTTMLAVIAFLVGFGGRLFGLWPGAFCQRRLIQSGQWKAFWQDQWL